MLGGKFDVLGSHVEKNSPAAYPQDMFLNRPLFTMPWLGQRMSVNEKANHYQPREVVLRTVRQQQPIMVSMHNQEEQVFAYGGLAFIPSAGIWAGMNEQGS